MLPLLWAASYLLPSVGAIAALILGLVWSWLHVNRDNPRVPHVVRVRGVSVLVYTLLVLCWLGALYQLASFFAHFVSDIDSAVLY